MRRWEVSLIVVVLLILPALSGASAMDMFTIVIKDHKFEPATLHVPQGQQIQIVVDNQDPTEEEFESFDLNREKVISGGEKITLYVGPLKPGSYSYFGEFYPKTAQGTIVAE